MKLDNYEVPKKDARKYWREYVEACKKNPKDKFLLDMKKTYHQLKFGRKVIDINKVIIAGGFHKNYAPKIAIAQAVTKNVRCRVARNGKISFFNAAFRKSSMRDVFINQAFAPVEKNTWSTDNWGMDKQFEAPVPKIPASLRPKGKLDKYHVLWEVEEWKVVPPRDPYLLRRITPNMFVVLAAWDLTELERSVMVGRMS